MTDLPNNTLDFGTIAPLEKVSRFFQITNQGEVALLVDRISLKQSNGVMQWNGLTTPATIEPGASHRINVTFKPDYSTDSGEVGKLTFTVSIDGATRPKVFVYLKANVKGGNPPPPPPIGEVLVWGCDGKLDFGGVPKGKSATKTCELKNSGDVPVTVKGIAYTANVGAVDSFQASGVKFPTVLAPGRKVTFSFHYKAISKYDEESGGFNLSTSPAAAGRALVVSAKQKEDPNFCQLQITPTGLAFQKPGAAPIIIENIGTAGCILAKVSVVNDGNGTFSLNPPPAPNYPLKPGEQLTLKVGNAVTDKKAQKGTIQVISNDPSRPTILIPLERSPLPKPKTCQLIYSPTSQDFGYVPTFKRVEQAFKLINTGDGPCLISSMFIGNESPPGRAGFSLRTVQRLPFVIKAKGRLDAVISFGSGTADFFSADLVIRTNSTKQAKITIPLKAHTRKPCIAASPQTLGFGLIQNSCSSHDGEIVLSHTRESGCGDVTIKSITSPKNALFTLQALTTPKVLSVGESVTLKVRFRPKRTGSFKDTILVSTDDRMVPTLPLQITGQGSPTDSRTDIFKQAKSPVVDLLFVIDNSCSMGDDQARLAQSTNSLIKWLWTAKVNFHAAVTTTDVTGRRYAPGCLQGQNPVVDFQTPNPGGSLAINIKVGTSGSATEAGLEAAYQALRKSNKSGCNKGFYRPHAKLSIIILSDEPDASKESAKFYANFFRNLKGPQHAAKVRVAAVVGPTPKGCRSSTASAGPALKYASFVKEVGGLVESICDVKWDSFFLDPKKMSQLGLDLQNTFQLRRPAKSGSAIVVKVNGVVVPQSTQNGWSYDAATNSITFARPALPPANAVIAVSYKASCLP